MKMLDEAPPPRSGLPWLAIGGALVVVVALAAAAWLLGREPIPAAPSPTPRAPAAPRRTPLARPSVAADRGPESTPPPEAPKATGYRLRVDSDVPGASVFVDRKYVGTTPVEIASLESGPRRLNVSAEGYPTHASTIDGDTAPREITVRFKEVTLDASVPAVHKHGIGSCRGTLSASAEGIRYTTDNREHAFSAPLGALATFEMDYLQKTLKVKLRSGKTWNFTHPDGQADPLLVFHRATEDARGRLAAGR
jgi:hypothetical protein